MRVNRVRPVRGLTAFFAVIVLLHAIAAQPVAACDHRHASSAHAPSDLMTDHDSGGGSDCDEPLPPVTGDHNADCLRVCLSMTGCATPAFVSEQTLADTVASLTRTLAPAIPFERLHLLRLDRVESVVLYVARATGELEVTGYRIADQAQAPSGGVLREFWDFLRYNKKWWLLPIIIVLLLVGVLIILGGTAAAPFIYTLF